MSGVHICDDAEIEREDGEAGECEGMQRQTQAQDKTEACHRHVISWNGVLGPLLSGGRVALRGSRLTYFGSHLSVRREQ